LTINVHYDRQGEDPHHKTLPSNHAFGTFR
jgi:hypothetical protein